MVSSASEEMGTFVFSLDTELAWGTLDLDGANVYREHFERTRENVRRLLNMFERWDVSVTWAFVGHLFLDQCTRNGDADDPHPDVLTPSYSWYDDPWHAADPATDLEAAPFWYGPDILDAVLDATPMHEIGCHTFSHPPLADEAVTPEIVRSQLLKCQELASERGLQLRSFAYPRNYVAHTNVLRETGFSSYRGEARSWYRNLPGVASRMGHFVDRLIGFTPPVYGEAKINSNVVNIPASMFLMPPDGVRKLIPGSSRVRQAKRGLAKSADQGAIFHLWFHPWNIGPSAQMFDWLESILAEVDRLRSAGRLRVMTMGALADEVLSATPTRSSASSAPN